MMAIKEDLAAFLEGQGFVIVSSLDERGRPHSACKGIVKMEAEGRVYLLDLYTGSTSRNLKANPRMSITVVDEERFKGYCLKGTARLVKREEIDPAMIEEWRRLRADDVRQGEVPGGAQDRVAKRLVI